MNSWPRTAISLLPEYLTMPDAQPAWMQGGGQAQPWFCSHYGASAEVELCDLLYAFIRLLKPELVVEGGCHIGVSTYAIGRALQDNGHGHCITSDVDSEYAKVARQRLHGLPVEVRCCSVMELPISDADFLYLDSSYETRLMAARRIKHGALAIVHDTRQEPSLREGLLDQPHIHCETWRGFSLVRAQ